MTKKRAAKKPPKTPTPKKPIRMSTHAVRANFRTLLDAAMKGQTIEITRYGRTVAQLTPVVRERAR